jgi:hypothetical protein
MGKALHSDVAIFPLAGLFYHKPMLNLRLNLLFNLLLNGRFNPLSNLQFHPSRL